MLRSLAIILIVYSYVEVSGAIYTSTRGYVWPKAAEETKGDTVYRYSSEHFNFEIDHHTCRLLDQAIERCKAAIGSVERIAKKVHHDTTRRRLRPLGDMMAVLMDSKSLEKINVVLRQPCEDRPHMEMDESYTLTVSSIAELKSASIWGIIRGLETFSQLFYLSKDYKTVLITGTEITDYPHYPFRGMMVDTSRHYLTVAEILTTLDAMAMNKMNVFHWHIVDDPSFPYQSETFPELSDKGAYYPSMIYSKSNIQTIIEYARERGIRVIVEIDTPGHAESWSASHPEIMAECNDEAAVMNPVKNETYQLLDELFQEVQGLFPDQYLHLGGDEVNFRCWAMDPEIRNYIKEYDMTAQQLQKMFTENLMQLLKKGTIPIVWEEALLSANTQLPKEALIQVWGWEWEKKMDEILKRGHKVLFSSYWYLNFQYWKYEFQDLYTGEPRVMMEKLVENKTLLENIVGGEACLWGEMVDGTNLVSRMWPRGSAPAEVLWSKTEGTVPQDAYHRIQEHTCRMLRRGIQAAPPAGPGFCVTEHNALPSSVDSTIRYDALLSTAPKYDAHLSTAQKHDAHLSTALKYDALLSTAPKYDAVSLNNLEQASFSVNTVNDNPILVDEHHMVTKVNNLNWYDVSNFSMLFRLFM